MAKARSSQQHPARRRRATSQQRRPAAHDAVRLFSDAGEQIWPPSDPACTTAPTSSSSTHHAQSRWVETHLAVHAKHHLCISSVRTLHALQPDLAVNTMRQQRPCLFPSRPTTSNSRLISTPATLQPDLAVQSRQLHAIRPLAPASATPSTHPAAHAGTANGQVPNSAVNFSLKIIYKRRAIGRNKFIQFNPHPDPSEAAREQELREKLLDEKGVVVADGDGVEATLLLPKGVGGTASSTQTFGNIIVSIVGTGVLGLPFAFRVAGWLVGSLAVIFAGISTFYCMLLLVCSNLSLSLSLSLSDNRSIKSRFFASLIRERVEEEEAEESTQIQTYGDLGGQAFGAAGRFATEFVVLISQCGGAVAYLVFIGQNLSSIFKSHSLPFSTFIFLLVPVEIALSLIRSLLALAPFSALADLCNVLAMAVVVKADLQVFDGTSGRKTVTSLGGMAFAGGVAVFCFEGFSMTLALEGSMRERRRFRKVLALSFLAITSLYLCFGAAGYLAYGDKTRDIITLNLPSEWSAIAVKMGSLDSVDIE
ncbi:hypothetical protein ACLOJK_041349 [Asimina triloba]